MRAYLVFSDLNCHNGKTYQIIGKLHIQARSRVEKSLSTLTNDVRPNWNTSGMQVFYEAKNVPVNSCMMLLNRKDAINFPRGNVLLGFCKVRGFISNVAFEAAKLVEVNQNNGLSF